MNTDTAITHPHFTDAGSVIFYRASDGRGRGIICLHSPVLDDIALAEVGGKVYVFERHDALTNRYIYKEQGSDYGTTH